MAAALVLNASYEPLSVVSARRAVVLAYRGRADVLATTDVVWRSESGGVAVPEVLRLRRYVRVPHDRVVPLSRRAVFLRDEAVCQYCGRRAENIDHVIPKVQGGRHIWENVVACCRRCNTRKGGRTPSQAGLTLRRTPTRPGRYDWVRVTAGSDLAEAWRPYLEGSLALT